MNQRKPFRALATFSLLIVIALLYQAWHARFGGGMANFDSDEAIIGLMSRHVLQGDIPTYYYGQNYLGSLDSIAIAPLLNLFGNDLAVDGHNIYLLRIWPILLYGLFLALQAAFVRKIAGTQVALFTLLIMAIPGWIVSWFIYRANVAYGLMSIIGTTALLVFIYARRLKHPAQRRDRFFQHCVLIAMGILAGVGLWIHPLTMVYFAAVALTFLLRSREWSDLHARWIKLTPRLSGVISPMLLALLVLMGMMVAFTSGCQPSQTLFVLRSLSMAGIGLIVVAIGSALIWSSTRRRQWISGGAALTLGFALGYAPAWRAWLLSNAAPAFGTLPSCPNGIVARAQLLAEQLIPTLWGLPSSLTLARISAAQGLIWLCIAGVVTIVCLWFVARHRRTIHSLITLSPLAQRDEAAAIVLIMFALPFVFVLFSGNVRDWTHARYLLISWQAGAIFMGSWFARLSHAGKHKSIALAVIGVWVVMVGFGNSIFTVDYFKQFRTRYAPVSLKALEQFMSQQQLKAGFGDYWLAYTLTYLTSERLTVAPINSIERYPAYTEAALSQPQQVYIFWRDFLPDSVKPHPGQSTHALSTWLTQHVPALFPEVARRLQNQVLLESHHVADWEVLIVGEP